MIKKYANSMRHFHDWQTAAEERLAELAEKMSPLRKVEEMAKNPVVKLIQPEFPFVEELKKITKKGIDMTTHNKVIEGFLKRAMEYGLNEKQAASLAMSSSDNLLDRIRRGDVKVKMPSEGIPVIGPNGVTSHTGSPEETIALMKKLVENSRKLKAQ